MINAAKLRHRITIEEPVPGRDQLGGVVENEEDWIAFTTAWAAVEPLRGREYFAAQQVNSELTHRVTMRYRADITPVMRVRFGDRIFRIQGPPINPEERNRELQLMCVEVV